MATAGVGSSTRRGAAPATRLPAHVHEEERSTSSRAALALAAGGCLTSEAGGARNPSPTATTYICITRSPPPHTPALFSDSRLEMRVGLPSEASSCRWSALGPRDPPERRRSGLTHVVRTRFSFHLLSFFKKRDFGCFCRGLDICKGANLPAVSFRFPFILIPNRKRAQSERETFPKFLWAVGSQKYDWPPKNRFHRGQGEKRRSSGGAEQKPLPAAPGP